MARRDITTAKLHKFVDPSGGGAGRASPTAIALPITETLPEHEGETLRFEFDKDENGKGVCRIIVLRDGREVDRVWFYAEHFASLKKLRKALQSAWRENIIASNVVMNFYGGMRVD